MLNAGVGQYAGLNVGDAAALLHDEGCDVDPAFPEIPAAGLRRELWVPKLWGAWRRREGILVLESRAALKGLKRILMTRHGQNMRQLLLCDNMACVLCFERGRCKNYAVLNVLREHCAYCMAKNVSVTMRWIPSELNVSDEPSRLYDTEDSKLLVDLLFDEWVRHGPATKSDVDSWDRGSVPQEPEPRPSRREEATCAGGDQGHTALATIGEANTSNSGLEQSVVREASVQEGAGAHVAHHAWSASSAQHFSSPAEAGGNRERKGGRERVAKGRQKRLLQQVVDAEMTGQSLLESAAVTKQVRSHYQRRLQDLDNFVRREGLPFSTDEDVDLAMVYLEGEGSHFGDYTVAAFLDKVPEFGRLGLRCLVMVQGRAKAMPISIEACLSPRCLARSERWKMVVLNLLQVLTYHRPNTLLKLEAYFRNDGALVHGDKPQRDSGHLQDWRKERLAFATLGLAPVSGAGSGDCQLWGSHGPGLGLQLLRVPLCLSEVLPGPEARASSISSPSQRTVNRSCVRGSKEVRKRGGWVSRQSVARYEKAGRLAATKSNCAARWRKSTSKRSS